MMSKKAFLITIVFMSVQSLHSVVQKQYFFQLQDKKITIPSEVIKRLAVIKDIEKYSIVFQKPQQGQEQRQQEVVINLSRDFDALLLLIIRDRLNENTLKTFIQLSKLSEKNALYNKLQNLGLDSVLVQISLAKELGHTMLVDAGVQFLKTMIPKKISPQFFKGEGFLWNSMTTLSDEVLNRLPRKEGHIMLKGNRKKATSFAYMGDNTLAVGYKDGTINILHINSKQIERTITWSVAVTSLMYWEKEKKLIAGYKDGQVKIWDPKTGKVALDIDLNKGRDKRVYKVTSVRRLIPFEEKSFAVFSDVTRLSMVGYTTQNDIKIVNVETSWLGYVSAKVSDFQDFSSDDKDMPVDLVGLGKHGYVVAYDDGTMEFRVKGKKMSSFKGSIPVYIGGSSLVYVSPDGAIARFNVVSGNTNIFQQSKGLGTILSLIFIGDREVAFGLQNGQTGVLNSKTGKVKLLEKYNGIFEKQRDRLVSVGKGRFAFELDNHDIMIANVTSMLFPKLNFKQDILLSALRTHYEKNKKSLRISLENKKIYDVFKTLPSPLIRRTQTERLGWASFSRKSIEDFKKYAKEQEMRKKEEKPSRVSYRQILYDYIKKRDKQWDELKKTDVKAEIRRILSQAALKKRQAEIKIRREEQKKRRAQEKKEYELAIKVPNGSKVKLTIVSRTLSIGDLSSIKRLLANSFLSRSFVDSIILSNQRSTLRPFLRA